jgi:hypothetical protein
MFILEIEGSSKVRERLVRVLLQKLEFSFDLNPQEVLFEIMLLTLGQGREIGPYVVKVSLSYP